ncbi:hypothetical protein [Nostoc sp.]|uniref:hypothetical protein n=1 Tax=Nostoc sp. TaxID=1180 RepID=UPI0035933B0F
MAERFAWIFVKVGVTLIVSDLLLSAIPTLEARRSHYKKRLYWFKQLMRSHSSQLSK